jgi:hypothetical protein
MTSTTTNRRIRCGTRLQCPGAQQRSDDADD